MTLDDALYEIETWTESYDPLPFTDLQLYQLADYFLRNLDRHHSVPGAVYRQIQGEMSWYYDHDHLTPRQRRWMMHTLKQHMGDLRR